MSLISAKVRKGAERAHEREHARRHGNAVREAAARLRAELEPVGEPVNGGHTCNGITFCTTCGALPGEKEGSTA